MSRPYLYLLFTVLSCVCTAPASAQVRWTVSILDPGQSYAAYDSAIQTDVLAAGNDWSQYLQGSGTVNLFVNFDPTLPTAEGASTTTAYVGYDAANSVPVYEQGAAYKARYGKSAQNTPYDGFITLGTNYLSQDLWFDPSPLTPTLPVPGNRVDAVSVFEHEIGHVLAFNGFRNAYTGALTTSYESTFDANVVAQNNGLFFVGPSAEAVYGGPVPLQVGDYGHLSGQEFPGDLMNGQSLNFGQRYAISPLDLAIAADSSVALSPRTGGTSPTSGAPASPSGSAAVPEAGQATLVLCGLTVLLAVPARRRWRLH